MRSFVAIEVPEIVKQSLVDLAASMKRSGIKASWAKPDNMHLTLRFLGEITGNDTDKLCELLGKRYSGFEPFIMNVEGVGVFPSVRRPSVIWAGIGLTGDLLSRAYEIAENAAREIGLEPERRTFHPHLTLGRIRDHRESGDLVSELDRHKDFHGGEIAVSSVSLFSSELTPNGAIHTRIEEFCFQCRQ